MGVFSKQARCQTAQCRIVFSRSGDTAASRAHRQGDEFRGCKRWAGNELNADAIDVFAAETVSWAFSKAGFGEDQSHRLSSGRWLKHVSDGQNATVEIVVSTNLGRRRELCREIDHRHSV